jgi:hypothetical protein
VLEKAGSKYLQDTFDDIISFAAAIEPKVRDLFPS